MRHLRCKDCLLCDAARKRQAEATLQKYKERRAVMLVHLGGSCVGCGTTECLNIHHRDAGKKEFAIGRIWSHALPKVFAELSKCELRCRDCHVETPSYGRNKRYAPYLEPGHPETHSMDLEAAPF